MVFLFVLFVCFVFLMTEGKMGLGIILLEKHLDLDLITLF